MTKGLGNLLTLPDDYSDGRASVRKYSPEEILKEVVKKYNWFRSIKQYCLYTALCNLFERRICTIKYVNSQITKVTKARSEDVGEVDKGNLHICMINHFVVTCTDYIGAGRSRKGLSTELAIAYIEASSHDRFLLYAWDSQGKAQAHFLCCRKIDGYHYLINDTAKSSTPKPSKKICFLDDKSLALQTFGPKTLFMVYRFQLKRSIVYTPSPEDVIEDKRKRNRNKKTLERRKRRWSQTSKEENLITKLED